MKKVMLIGAFVFSALAIQAQTVDEVVNKHIDAMGGAEKLKNLKAVRIQTSTEIMGQAIPTVSIVANGKGMRSDVSVMGSTISQGYDGQQGWVVNPMQGDNNAQPMPDEMKPMLASQLDLTGPLFNYKEKGNTVELLGKEKLNGVDVYKVKVSRKSGGTETQYIDATNYLNQKTISTVNVGGQSTDSEVKFADYKVVDGIKFPFLTETTHPQFGAMKITAEKVEVNPTIDETIFKMPAKK